MNDGIELADDACVVIVPESSLPEGLGTIDGEEVIEREGSLRGWKSTSLDIGVIDFCVVLKKQVNKKRPTLMNAKKNEHRALIFREEPWSKAGVSAAILELLKDAQILDRQKTQLGLFQSENNARSWFIIPSVRASVGTLENAHLQQQGCEDYTAFLKPVPAHVHEGSSAASSTSTPDGPTTRSEGSTSSETSAREAGQAALQSLVDLLRSSTLSNLKFLRKTTAAEGKAAVAALKEELQAEIDTRAAGVSRGSQKRDAELTALLETIVMAERAVSNSAKVALEEAFEAVKERLVEVEVEAKRQRLGDLDLVHDLD